MWKPEGIRISTIHRPSTSDILCLSLARHLAALELYGVPPPNRAPALRDIVHYGGKKKMFERTLPDILFPSRLISEFAAVCDMTSYIGHCTS